MGGLLSSSSPNLYTLCHWSNAITNPWECCYMNTWFVDLYFVFFVMALVQWHDELHRLPIMTLITKIEVTGLYDQNFGPKQDLQQIKTLDGIQYFRNISVSSAVFVYIRSTFISDTKIRSGKIGKTCTFLTFSKSGHFFLVWYLMIWHST